MALSETQICNMALKTIGSSRINDLYTDTSSEAAACRDFYEAVRDACLRMYDWPFARARAELSQDTNTPDFEWDYAFLLPQDYLSLRKNYTESRFTERGKRFEIEGKRLLTNDSKVQLKYIRKVTDPNEFDPLFVELLVLKLAVRLLFALGGIGNTGTTKDRLEQELQIIERKAKTVSASEAATEGRSDWNMAAHSGLTIDEE
ncbi:MAG TPA: hypothetical protein PLV55_06055 [Anaerohalosphaeraceae bacterium]|nr:hypothetical protein [Anaerohalosphaeraceae bacterium]